MARFSIIALFVAIASMTVAAPIGTQQSTPQCQQAQQNVNDATNSAIQALQSVTSTDQATQAAVSQVSTGLTNTLNFKQSFSSGQKPSKASFQQLKTNSENIRNGTITLQGLNSTDPTVVNALQVLTSLKSARKDVGTNCGTHHGRKHHQDSSTTVPPPSQTSAAQ